MPEDYFNSSLTGEEIESRLLGAVVYNATQNIPEAQRDKARQNISAMRDIAVDSEPRDGSTNLITSGGVYSAMGGVFSPEKMATPGALVHFEDGAFRKPVDALRLAINPVQNLHGYANPWPGGGEKNKLPQLFFQHSTTMVYVGTDLDGTYVTALPEGTYTLSASLNVSGRFYIREQSGSSNVPVGAASLTPSGSFTVPAGGGAYNIWLYNGSDGMTVANINWVQLESGSTATEYAPYENICPINGWDAAEITRTGSNLVSPFAWTYTNTAKGVTFSFTPENVTITGTSTGTNADSSNIAFASPIKLFAGQTYVFAINGTWSTPSLRLFLRNASNGNLWYGDSTNCQWTVTPTKDIEVHRIMLRVREENATVNVSGAFYCNLGSLGAYEPYKGTTYSVSFATAGTVYGGILTNNGDGTWTLTVDKTIRTLTSSLSWSVSTGSGFIQFFATLSDMANSLTAISNMFQPMQLSERPTKTGMIRYNDNIIRFSLTTADASAMGISNLGEWQTWINNNNLQIVYPLASPQTFTLTGPEVLTLLSINNLWADTGDIEELAYRADIGLYLVDALNPIKEMLANRESSMTATRNYTAGDYIIVGNTLYKVLTNIANGTSLTINGNVRITTVGAELKTALV